MNGCVNEWKFVNEISESQWKYMRVGWWECLSEQGVTLNMSYLVMVGCVPSEWRWEHWVSGNVWVNVWVIKWANATVKTKRPHCILPNAHSDTWYVLIYILHLTTMLPIALPRHASKACMNILVVVLWLILDYISILYITRFCYFII